MELSENNLSFGKRFGFEPVEIPFQITEIDAVLRTELWNAFHIFIFGKIEDAQSYEESKYRSLHRVIWVHYLRRPIDEFPYNDSSFGSIIRAYLEKELWYKVYEFFEFVLRQIRDEQLYNYQQMVSYINVILKRNAFGYTVINSRFTPVISEAEINEIKLTQNKAEKYALAGVREHLNTALLLISQKPTPDYRNTIKESISMVEVISRMIEPSETTLGKALNRLDKNKKINSTLKAGFEKLYAFTNDKNGIRHALLEEESLGIEDARFFLVSCSAFTNYLIEKAKELSLVSESNS